jgi:hypothetical protein
MNDDETPDGRSRMKKPSKRAAAIGAAVAVAAGGTVGGALAASGTFDPAAERQAFLNDAAGRLGVPSTKLDAALKAAAIDRVDAALASGQITKAQADAMKAAINAGKLPLGLGYGRGFGGGGMHGGLHGGQFLGAAATYLGLTEDQLRTQLQSGKTLAAVATAQGKSVDGLKQAIIAAEQSELDQAVAAGRLTSAQRDQILADLKTRIDDIVNGTMAQPKSAFRDGFRFAPGGFAAPLPAEAPGASLPTA